MGRGGWWAFEMGSKPAADFYKLSDVLIPGSPDPLARRVSLAHRWKRPPCSGSQERNFIRASFRVA